MGFSTKDRGAATRPCSSTVDRSQGGALRVSLLIFVVQMIAQNMVEWHLPEGISVTLCSKEET